MQKIDTRVVSLHDLRHVALARTHDSMTFQARSSGMEQEQRAAKDQRSRKSKRLLPVPWREPRDELQWVFHRVRESSLTLPFPPHSRTRGPSLWGDSENQREVPMRS